MFSGGNTLTSHRQFSCGVHSNIEKGLSISLPERAEARMFVDVPMGVSVPPSIAAQRWA
jgi:hypothetical protein